MIKVTTATLLILLVHCTQLTYSKEKTFEREYTYQASELDSKTSCRTITINQLRTILLNEIGVYVQSESLLKTTEINGVFSQDFVENIATISAGVTKLQVLDEKWDGETFWMKAAITIDEESIAESLKQVVSDKQRMKEMENLKQQLKAATEEIDNLKKITRSTKTDGVSDMKISKLYDEEINSLNAVSYFLSGNSKHDSRDYQGAIEDYSKAIEMQTNYVDAYHNRGTAKGYLKDYNGAIFDLNEVIKIDPKHELAYYNRGNAKDDLKDYTGAINDYDIAIKLNPLNSHTYNNRGIAKSHMKDYNGAIADYNKALEISPKDAEIYYNRGLAKFNVGRRDGGCFDLSKANELGHEKANSVLVKRCN